jgi:hypothetical protein
MPISPQIVITPEDIIFKSFSISAVSYTSTTATYTATGHTLSAGNIVQITGLSPDGYNGTYTISSVATNTFTIANATNTVLTDQTGNAYWADPTDYEYDGGQTVTYIPDSNELDELEVAVEGKAQIFYQTTAPVGAGINEDDLWYDTDDGNKPYIFRSGVWVSVQDGSIATAQSAANTALANAATANAVGVAAQNTANTALANAATAFTAATGSLQPSANTIVNSTNQITAINGNGITVYSGASATSGARVVLNSAGLAGFNSGGAATFSISASTGAAVFSGSVTGSTITGGTLNIGGNAIINSSGFLTATGATITGTITTSNITVTGGTLTIGSKFSVTSTGVLTATDGVFTGTVTSTNATITGGSLTVGSTFSVTSAGVLTATSGTVGGFTISGSSIFAGTSLVLNTDGTLSGGNSSTLFYGYVNVGGGFPSGARFQVNGNSEFTGNIIATNNITAQNDFYYPFPNVVSGTANLRVIPGSTPAGRIVDNGASSQRYKHDIVNLRDVPELDPRKLYELPVRAFKYNLDYLSTDDDRYDVLIPGFIAEEVDEFYPLAADYEPKIGIHTWNDRMLIPAMMALIQDLHKEINQLKGK